MKPITDCNCLQKHVKCGGTPGALAGGTPMGPEQTCPEQAVTHRSHGAPEPHESRATGPGHKDASAAGNRALGSPGAGINGKK